MHSVFFQKRLENQFLDRIDLSLVCHFRALSRGLVGVETGGPEEGRETDDLQRHTSIHCWASRHSQGFEDMDLGSSPGLLGQ